MGSKTIRVLALGTILPLLGGCLVIVGEDGDWDFGGPTHRTTVVDERPLDTMGLTALEVRTHNGTIDFTGQDAGEASVTITKKAGGVNEADALEAMDAIEVFVEKSGGTTRLGWKWNVPKHRRWHGEVSFAVRAPKTLRLEAETHNGAIDIAGVEGEVRAETHNGKVKVNSGGGALFAQTHNGEIDVSYAGSKITLETHNGEITADLTRCGSVSGDVTSHNGAVVLSVGSQTSANVNARTHNGEVRCDAPASAVEQSRGRFTGTLGTGGGKLDVVTHNGQIRLRS